MKIITIGREFGSGGRELGKRMADLLGFAYYDQEIVEAIARQSNFSESYVSEFLEKGMSRSIPLTFGRTFAYLAVPNHNATNILIAQQKIVKELVTHGDCIIMGQNADAVLRDENPLRLFVYAQMQSKIERCKVRADANEGLTDNELKRKIKQVDAGRSSRHDLVSNLKWGAKENYHLCVNTTNLNIKAIAPQIAEYAKLWLDLETKKHNENSII